MFWQMAKTAVALIMLILARRVDGSKPRMQMYLWTSSNTPYLIVNSPSSVQGSYTAVPAAFGPALPNWPSGITANVVIAQDNASPFSDAAQIFRTGSSISGKIALVDRETAISTKKCLTAKRRVPLRLLYVIMCRARLYKWGAAARALQFRR